MELPAAVQLRQAAVLQFGQLVQVVVPFRQLHLLLHGIPVQVSCCIGRKMYPLAELFQVILLVLCDGSVREVREET